MSVGLDLAKETKYERQERFLRFYEQCGTLSGAARRAGIRPENHYAWLNDKDEQLAADYKARFKLAHEAMIDVAEEELRRRGVEGDERTVWWQGIPCGTYRQFSDNCLIFYLKGRRGDVFQEKIQNAVSVAVPVSIYLPSNDRGEDKIIEGEAMRVELLENGRNEED